MDGLVDELLRLEGAKHEALITIDAQAYEATVQEQVRLLAESKHVRRSDVTKVQSVLALSQLITLNTRLLRNLLSTTPVFHFSGNYTPGGRAAAPAVPRHVSVEA